MFPDFEAIQALQKDLDSLIQEGVQNITELLKSTKEIDQENSQEALTRHGVLKDSVTLLDIEDSPRQKQGKIEQELLNSNVLSPEMLEKLKLEWSEQSKRTNKYAQRITRRPKGKNK